MHALLPGIRNPFPALWTDAIDRFQIGGIVTDHAQNFRAKVSDQFLREDGANALHEAAAQVPLDTLAGGRRDDFQDLGLELEPVLLIPNPPAFRRQPLSGADRRQRAEYRYQISLSPNFDAEHGEPALLVKERDPLH